MPADGLNLKEMCALFDVTPRTLRHYEYIELLAPERQGRSRVYRPREVARMKLILGGRRFGFSLEQIRQWLEVYDSRGDQEQIQVWLDAVRDQLGVLESRRDEMNATISELRELHNFVEKNRSWPAD